MNYTPRVGYTYLVEHRRAGNFTALCEAVDIQDVHHGTQRGMERHTWIKLRVLEGEAFRLMSRDPVEPGQTVELLMATTYFSRPKKAE